MVSVGLCGLLAWFSFTRNISENLAELEILRAIGIPARQIRMVFMLEVFAVVTSALALGSFVGTVTSFTLALQLTVVIAELPLRFPWPSTEFLLIVVFSLAVSLLVTYSPMRKFSRYVK